MPALRLINPTPLAIPGRMRELDELKGLAMVLVIVYHIGGIFGWQNWVHGEVGVDIFLIVSGFTLAHTSRDMPWSEFLRRRLLRIFPAYWVALGFFILLARYFFETRFSTSNLVTHVLGIHGVALWDRGAFSAINDSFWFITLILLMYLIFLPLRKHLADPSRVLGTGLLLSAVSFWIYDEAQHHGGSSQLVMRIPAFFIGLVAAQLFTAEKTEFRVTSRLVLGLLAVAYVGWWRGFFWFYAFGGPAVIIAYLLARQSLLKHPDGRFLLGAFALTGVYSYEIFLFHQPLIRDYNRLFWSRALGIDQPNDFQLGIGIIVGLALTWAISWALHRGTNFLFARKPKPGAAPLRPPAPPLPYSP
jgi:peptidoglycan/LPS O-acetylase OafA/YrhL